MHATPQAVSIHRHLVIPTHSLLAQFTFFVTIPGSVDGGQRRGPRGGCEKTMGTARMLGRGLVTLTFLMTLGGCQPRPGSIDAGFRTRLPTKN